ncbi:MAG: hypothetical protein IPK61_05585 [Saprospiraceae bacterium]|nr:hypothetical protein [Saprospiraceae bacterium]
MPTNPHKVKSYNTIKLNYDPAVKKYYVFPYLNAFSPAMLPPCTASTGCEAGKVYFVVKQNGVFLGRRLITINTNNSLSLDNNQAIPVQISDEASRYITIELNADGSYRSQQFLHLIDFRLLANLSGLPLALIGDVEYYPEINKKNFHAIRRPQVNLNIKDQTGLGHFFRGWGQFMYNPSADVSPNEAPSDAFGKLVNNNKMILVPPTQEESDAMDDIDVDDFDNIDDLSGLDGIIDEDNLEFTLPGFENLKMPSQVVIYPRPAKHLVQNPNGSGLEIWKGWVGPSVHNYAVKYGSKTMNFRADGELLVDEGSETYDYGDSNTGAKSTKRYVGGNSLTGCFGLSVSPFNAGKNGTFSSFSESLNDYTDVNGDRYPDIVMDNFEQITNSTGGLYATETGDPGNNGVFLPGPRIRPNVSKTTITSSGKSASGTYPDISVLASNPKRKHKSSSSYETG